MATSNRPPSNKRSRSEQAAALLAEQEQQERRRRFAMIGGVVAVLAVIVGLTWWGISRDTSGETASTVPAGVTDDFGVLLGDASAETSIVVYEDLQCPVCADFETAAGEQMQSAIDDGTAQVEFRIVSFLDGASSNEYSSRAANALFVVLDTSGTEVFKEFHDLLFANQPAEGGPGPTDEELIQIAVQAGADEDAITGPINDKIYEQWIVNATDAMSKNGVTGTPTGFINGELVEGTTQDLIDAVLAALQ
jgi:protein-disulfide isomerase